MKETKMIFEKLMNILIECKNQSEIDQVFAEALLVLNDDEWDNFCLFVKVQEQAI